MKKTGPLNWPCCREKYTINYRYVFYFYKKNIVSKGDNRNEMANTICMREQQISLYHSLGICSRRKTVVVVVVVFVFLFCFVMPRHQKSGGVLCYTLWNFECPSVCMSVRPSVGAPIIRLPATPPTVLGQSFSNFTGAFRMVWRYAYCFFRILKLFLLHFLHF